MSTKHYAYLAQPNSPKCSWKDCIIPSNAVFASSGHIGKNVEIHSPIGTPDKPLDYVYIGDNVYIGEGCNISVPKLVVGDYTKIHRNSLVFGRNPLKIGYNCWFGEGTIIDAEGKTTIGNNVGVGAHSQLWSHIRHGDTLQGCRFLSFSELTIEDDVWFVGHCIVSPIRAQARSMAMVGSVVTRDMEYNHIYGGSPAKDLTDKLGTQFTAVTPEQIQEEFRERYKAFNACTFFKLALDLNFDPVSRTYIKTGTDAEFEFMKFLLPEAKFVPSNESLPDV